MNLITTADIIDLLDAESDITITSIDDDRAYMTHAPLDIEGDYINFDDNGVFIQISTITQYLSEEVFGTPVKPLFDENSVWSHVIV